MVFGEQRSGSVIKSTVDSERWVTIGADKDEPGHGTHIKISGDGKIVAGPAGLADKGIRSLSDFGKGKAGEPGSQSGAKKPAAGQSSRLPHEMSKEEFAKSGAQTFQTAKGSTYSHQNGQTVRVKTQHEGHDTKDVGLKNKSDETHYVNPQDAKEIGMWQTLQSSNKRIVRQGDELLLTSKNPKTGKQGLDGRIKIQSKEPKVGLAPVELFDKSSQGEGWYRGNHPGNEITSMTKPEDSHGEFVRAAGGKPSEVSSPAKQTQEKPKNPESQKNSVDNPDNTASIMSGPGSESGKQQDNREGGKVETREFNKRTGIRKSPWTVGQTMRAKDGSIHVVAKVHPPQWDDSHSEYVHPITARPATEEESAQHNKTARIGELERTLDGMRHGPDDERGREDFNNRRNALDDELRKLQGKPSRAEEESAKPKPPAANEVVSAAREAMKVGRDATDLDDDGDPYELRDWDSIKRALHELHGQRHSTNSVKEMSDEEIYRLLSESK